MERSMKEIAAMNTLTTAAPAEMERRPGASFSIADWCRHRQISVSMFYKLLAQGKAPVSIRVGRRRTITAEADAAWARAQQAETTQD
jgi:hypothetical protein